MPATRTRQPAAREAGRPRKSAALRTAAVTKRDDSTLQSLAREIAIRE